MSNYDLFLEALNQLEQDQSLYESEVGTGELQGVQHEEIVKIGGSMTKRLKKFAQMGQSFAETLPPDFLTKIIDSIQSYQSLIVPPKVFGGFCPCLKPSRSGPEYEKKMLQTKAKMVSTVFLVHAVVVEDKGEKINMESMHYADYCNKMNTVFNVLSEIKCSGSEKALENARLKLLESVTQVEKFINHFGDNNPDFQAEASRRIKSTAELLNSRSTNSEGMTLPPSKRVLIKAQSGLQEIMNSAAAIALTQAKENLNLLEDLAKALKKSRDNEVQQFNSMEDAFHEHGLAEILGRLREDSEVIHSDANTKLRDATKRWTSIKQQSNPRKVAEYSDDASDIMPKVVNGQIGDIDPTKVLAKTGDKIKDTGKNVFSKIGNAKNELVKNLEKSGEEIKKLADETGGKIKKAGKEVGALIGVEETPPKDAKKGTGTGKGAGGKNKDTTNSNNSSNNNVFGISNPLEGMLDGGNNSAKKGTKKKSASANNNALNIFA